MKILDYMREYDHEELVFCCDSSVGLNAIIAIHDTTLGPALGGARMWPYKSEDEAILDVLRLSRAMTYKSSAAGVNLGGGKAVIIGDPARDKSPGLFRSLGRFIESLNGRYITTEDVGTCEQDMQHISGETTHVTGLPLSWGSSGDPSLLTGFGVYQGMKACAREVLGSDSLHNRTVAIQGFGKVGSYLAGHLHDEGVNIVAADINDGAAQRARETFGVTLVKPDEIYDVACDIFAPCALGATLNRQTISRLKCRIVAGCANNQLKEDKDGDRLQQREILYAPDYILNAGGIINISLEFTGYDPELAKARVAEIYHTMERVIALSKSEQISTARAADKLARDRIEEARRGRKIYLHR
ncbi:MAG: Glu/Leu/Phe/Val dehydrogenase dimerization domain-containing protein [Dehalococcoidales bacterium]|nr:Glu/Leu/Phe/Val dehydrogenase dimerization domain-containing protein [Dehalococcoidales bacterium]